MKEPASCTYPLTYMLLSLVATLILSGCVQSMQPFDLYSAASAQPPSKVLRIAKQGELSHFDPAYISTGVERWVGRSLFEPLIYIDPQSGKIVPLAAEALSVSEDERTVLFTLRDDLKWSDGSPVTAYEYEYALRRIIRSSTRSPHRLKLLGVEGVSRALEGEVFGPNEIGILARSPRQLEIKFAAPSFRMMQIFTQAWSAPLKKFFVDAYQGETVVFKDWVGNGPFVPVRKQNQILLLRKNPHHRWYKKIKVDEVSVFLTESETELLSVMEQFPVHLIGQQGWAFSESLQAHLTDKKYRMAAQMDLSTLFLRINNARVPLSQPQVREAIALFLDRESLLSFVGGSQYVPAHAIVPGSPYGYRSAQTFYYSPHKGQTVIGQSGYCTGAVQNGCQKLGFVELIYVDKPTHRRLALGIQSVLEGLMSFQFIELKGLSLADFKRRVARAQFDIALDEVLATEENPFALLEYFLPAKVTAGSFSHFQFSNTIEKAQESLVAAESLAHYAQAESILLGSAEIIPLFHGLNPYAVHRNLKGFDANVLDVHPLSRFVVP